MYVTVATQCYTIRFQLLYRYFRYFRCITPKTQRPSNSTCQRLILQILYSYRSCLIYTTRATQGQRLFFYNGIFSLFSRTPRDSYQ